MTDKEKIRGLIEIIETICREVREKHVDDSVCGLCEYDADHGIDGYANECPGFEKNDCFCLSSDFRKNYESFSEPEYERLKERDRARRPNMQTTEYQQTYPIYEYFCTVCHHQFTDKVKFCPHCGQRTEWPEER